MTWKFHVRAAIQRRLFSRILQILESQMVVIILSTVRPAARRSRQHSTSLSQEDKVYRIEALLYRMEGVKRVSSSIIDR